MALKKHKGLGRVGTRDHRDLMYQMSELLPPTTERTFRYWWDEGYWGDQGHHPACVGFAWLHLLEDGPVTQEPRTKGETRFDGLEIYREAQKRDEWAGEDYEGTSVRAGAKLLRERGLISRYYWAWDVATVERALLDLGPVVVGTDWFEGMFTPDEDGFVHPTGAWVGGHAYLLNGVNVKERKVRAKNSWGRNWGENGQFWLHYDDLATLLARYGEACVPTEVRIP